MSLNIIVLAKQVPDTPQCWQRCDEGRRQPSIVPLCLLSLTLKILMPLSRLCD